MLETILKRRSIRSYLDRPLEPEKIQALLTAGMYAPSADNKRPWHFIVCDDRALIDRLSDVHPYSRMLKKAPACIVVCGDKTAQYSEGFYPLDCSAAAQNILLAACEMDIGSCWISLEPIPERVNRVAGIFGLPPHIVPFCMIALGYPKYGHPPTPADRFETR